MKNKEKKYALFHMARVKKRLSDYDRFFGIPQVIEGDEWKEEYGLEDKDVTKELVFVAYVDSAKEVAAIVRKAPLLDYTLFVGEFSKIQVAMPVMVDGKSLDTMEAEGFG